MSAEDDKKAVARINVAKILGSDEMREALEEALERCIASGANESADLSFVVIATDANGWTGAADTGSFDLEQYHNVLLTFERDGAEPVELYVSETKTYADILSEASVVLAEGEKLFDEDDNEVTLDDEFVLDQKSDTTFTIRKDGDAAEGSREGGGSEHDG